MKVSSSKRRVVVAALILLALFWLRPGASRLKSRIISSLSAGVGRSVDVGSVHVRLLPRPGFDLDNLVVYDDPAFGAEPILRASEVTADLRLMSLLRGRLEISRLDLTEPSLNLVHSEGGKWNLEALLERTAHTPLAPTGKTKSEPRPAFPYIEGTSARINFKNGPEKKPYALTNADFSLWQESENTWGVRLKAQPVRADLNLNDTGLLQVSGTWQRAATLHETPLQFSLEWSGAQLGQVSKLFTGNDRGWRGAIQLDVTLTGSPAKLEVVSAVSINDFRRYDITAGRALRLAASCNGEYSSQTHEFHQVKCAAPVAKGLITLTGEMGLAGRRRYAVTITAADVPASALAALAQRAKKNLPDDLVADGLLQGKFSMAEDVEGGAKLRWEGRGEIADFRLSSAAVNAEIGRTTLPFLILSDSTALKATLPRRKFAERRSEMAHPAGPYLEFGPTPLDAGHALVRGWINRSAYDIAFSGDIEVARTLRLGRMIGLPVPTANPEGSAQLDLQIAGAWRGQNGVTVAGFIGPQITGTARLRNVRLAIRDTGPVEIVSADVQLSPDTVEVEKLNADAAGATWTGSLEIPRGCTMPEACSARFALNAQEIVLGQLEAWVHPTPKKRPWYQVLEGTPAGPSFLARVRASGSVTAASFKIHSVTATHVAAKLDLDKGNLQISTLTADVFGGKHRGEWRADFSLKPAVCSGSGSLAGLSLASVATAMKNPWITGTADARYEVKGRCPAEFWQSAEGTMQVEMKEGVLPNFLVGEDATALRITRLRGQVRLHAGNLEIDGAKLDSPEGAYEVTGTATLQRELALKMTRSPGSPAAGAYAISGTLAKPTVTPLARAEQARLKPLPSK